MTSLQKGWRRAGQDGARFFVKRARGLCGQCVHGRLASLRDALNEGCDLLG